MSQDQGLLLAWAAAYLGVEMPEPLSTEGVVAGLGQGVARDSPGVPAARAQEHSLSKPLCLTFHIVEAGLPWSRVCLYIYVYVYTHCMCLLVMAACARERCSLCLAGDGAVGQSVWDSVPCRREMACPWGPWPLRPPGSSLREPPARRKG